jgi:hypothetical protein
MIDQGCQNDLLKRLSNTLSNVEDWTLTFYLLMEREVTRVQPGKTF